MNEKLVYRDENGIITFFIGMILMFVSVVKIMFNKNELMNFTLIMGVNMMMFGVVFGFIGVMGQYFRRILTKVNEE